MSQFKKLIIILIAVIAIIFIIITRYAHKDILTLFPLNNYNQSISTWINASDPDFDKPLLSEAAQQQRLSVFYTHYFGDLSPWNKDHINKIFQSSSNGLKSIEKELLQFFSNKNKSPEQIGYGENFRPYEMKWIDEIAENVFLEQFTSLTYQPNHRGIAVDNLYARALPTDDVHFYHYTIAGQGYPFDNLQISALWAGTPVYVVGESRDHIWKLVISPDFIGWVKSNGIALVDDAFVNTWSKAAKNKLVAITQTKTNLIDDKQNFLLQAYVGTVFPGKTDFEIMVPVTNAERHAIINYAHVTNNNSAVMPLRATPHHFSDVMSTLIGRPYGWGNLYFYNDCSGELKSLFTPFGIWLPRHSSDQINAGKITDMTSASKEKRLAYLMEHGQRFMTLIYVGAHVMLYIGNYPNPHDASSLMAMTYQNKWGLSPEPATRRAVIGKSVFLPMLLRYPEDTSLVSLAGEKYFTMSYLGEQPASNILMQEELIDLKTLMYPTI